MYLDAQLQIRAVDIIELESSNIFSEKFAKEIMEKLMNEINVLQEENMELKGLLDNIELPDEILPESEPSEDIEIIAEEEQLEEDLDESPGSFTQVSDNVYRIKSKTPRSTAVKSNRLFSEPCVISYKGSTSILEDSVSIFITPNPLLSKLDSYCSCDHSRRSHCVLGGTFVNRIIVVE